MPLYFLALPTGTVANYDRFLGMNTPAPYFGHFIVSESIRMISLGGIE
jgi:hypothetical protein